MIAILIYFLLMLPIWLRYPHYQRKMYRADPVPVPPRPAPFHTPYQSNAAFRALGWSRVSSLSEHSLSQHRPPAPSGRQGF